MASLFPPQLSINKTGVVKLGADLYDPGIDTLDYWKVSIVHELQTRDWNLPLVTIWLVGEFIHATTMAGTYRVNWRNCGLLEVYLRMNTQNLTTLANFLDKLDPEKFDMVDFARDEHGEQHMNPKIHECTTVGCAVGWGPAAGIHVSKDDFDYFDYAKRVFGLSFGEPAFEWCFDGGWAWIDNTPTGAAKRIRHLVRSGVPDDAADQRLGMARYMFA